MIEEKAGKAEKKAGCSVWVLWSIRLLAYAFGYLFSGDCICHLLRDHLDIQVRVSCDALLIAILVTMVSGFQIKARILKM